MTETPDEALYDYSVAFFMQGIERRFVYELSRQTSERVREALEDEETGNLVFEAFRPAERIVVNSRLIQLARFGWRPKGGGDDRVADTGGGDAEGGNGGRRAPGGERTNTIRFYFAGREEPIDLVVDDPEEVFDLVLALETEAFPRCSVVDSNGEEAVLDIRKLVCAEFPRGLADRGEAQALFELQEDV
jgi:hypothetical protein